MALGDDQATSLVYCVYHLHLWKKNSVCYQQDLFVAKQFYRHGIARKLIEAVYAQADQLNLADAYWLTQNQNIQAQRLYNEIGQTNTIHNS